MEWIVQLLGERWRELLPLPHHGALDGVFGVASSLNHIHLRMKYATHPVWPGSVSLLALVSARAFGGYLFSEVFYGTLYAFSAVQILYYVILISVSVFLLSVWKNGKNKLFSTMKNRTEQNNRLRAHSGHHTMGYPKLAQGARILGK